MSQQPLNQTQPQVQSQVQPKVESKPKTRTEFQPEDFDRAIDDFGRALAVYFTWKSAGLLDR